MNPKDLKTKIKDLLVIKNDDGTYHLFGKYQIERTGVNNYVVFTQEQTFEFSSLRHAVTWCVFDKNNKYKEVKRIHELDGMLGSIEVHMSQHSRLAAKYADETKDIYLAKLYEDKLRKKQVITELSEFINLSKHWQSKKFAENSNSR